MCGVAQRKLRYSGFYWDTYVVIKMDASVNHAVRSLECLRFMCRLLPAAKCVVFFMDIHSYIKYTVHRGLPVYAVIPVALPSIVSIQVNPRPYNGEVTSYYLLSQISISADHDDPAFSKAGTFFLLRYLKNGREMSVVSRSCPAPRSRSWNWWTPP